MPVRNEVNAADTIMPPTATLRSGFAQCHIAIAAAGRPNILKKNAPARMPAVGSPAKKRLMSPLTGLAGARVDVAAHLEEERHVPDVVQAERDQQAFDEAVDRGGGARRADRGPVRERADALPIGGQTNDSTTPSRSPPPRDDRHEALAGEEAEVRGQRDAVVAVEQEGRQPAGQDAAEHTGLDRRQAHDGVGLDAHQVRHHAQRHGGHEVADRRGDRRDAVVVRESQRDADREDQRQVAEDHVARVLHHLQQRERHVAVEIGRAQAEQQAGHRQHRHRQHQRLADFLQSCKGLLEHGVLLSLSGCHSANAASRARTSWTVDSASTSWASASQRPRVTRFTAALTAAIAGTDTDSSSMPSPISSGTASASEARPPQTPTQRP
jgi:hypothetical protein